METEDNPLHLMHTTHMEACNQAAERERELELDKRAERERERERGIQRERKRRRARVWEQRTIRYTSYTSHTGKLATRPPVKF